MLALYDPLAKSKISADGSLYGLGTVLLQQQGEKWIPVAYASRFMTDAEHRHAQIQEALAITCACPKFSTTSWEASFLSNPTVSHKPLIPLLGNKWLDDLPLCIVRFRLRLSKFSYSIEHVPGKLMYAANTLSRAPVMTPGEICQNQREEDEMFVSAVTEALPASGTRLGEYKKDQNHDPECKAVKEQYITGWPRKHHVPGDLKEYSEVRGSLTVHNDLLLYNGRIIVPHILCKRKYSQGTPRNWMLLYASKSLYGGQGLCLR